MRAELDQGKADFNRYAESGQIMINRAMHLGEQTRIAELKVPACKPAAAILVGLRSHSQVLGSLLC